MRRLWKHRISFKIAKSIVKFAHRRRSSEDVSEQDWYAHGTESPVGK